jgi:hypothetical protein
MIMKVSKILLAGLAGVALVYVVKRLASLRAISAAVDELFFDTEFLPGTKKINQSVADNPEMRNWFRTRQSVAPESDEAMFI